VTASIVASATTSGDGMGRDIAARFMTSSTHSVHFSNG
jgi:hypothetical protein